MASKKKAPQLRKSIRPLMESEAGRIADSIKEFETNVEQYRKTFRTKPFFMYDADGGAQPATLVLSGLTGEGVPDAEARKGGAEGGAGDPYIRVSLLEAPLDDSADDLHAQVLLPPLPPPHTRSLPSLRPRTAPSLRVLLWRLFGCSSPSLSASTQTSAIGDSAEPAWPDELRVQMQKGAPRPPLLKICLWDKEFDANAAMDPLASCEVRSGWLCVDPSGWCTPTPHCIPHSGAPPPPTRCASARARPARWPRSR